MPLYEYECSKCGGRFEEIQKFSDEPLKKHEGCGGKVRRLLSAPAIQFKGSGWYVTDYGRAGKTDGASEKKADTKSGKDNETKTESKAESKSKDSSASDSKSKETTKTTDSSKK